MAHIPRAICGCGHEMKIKKNGKTLQANTGGEPYYKVSVDEYECPNCLAVVYLPANEVMTIHHQDNFDAIKHDAEFNLAH